MADVGAKTFALRSERLCAAEFLVDVSEVGGLRCAGTLRVKQPLSVNWGLSGLSWLL